MKEAVFKIKGVVQHYAWGGYTFIPSLLGVENAEHLPYAEYWLGTHPQHPAMLEDHTSLATYLKKNPLGAGENTTIASEGIPFLLKILDVRQMLSIQVHPGKKAAVEGYEKEENAGIPLHAPARNYKDKNHKPEMMVALGDFYLLHGFRPPEKMRSILQQVPELNFLLPFFKEDNYKSLYEHVMRLPQETVDAILKPLADRILPAYERNEFSRDDENFWAARAIKEFCKINHFDRGIFSVYLFNLVHLKKGQGIFQDHGLPHAYLEGQNVEVMANSDNVLRAGLTVKNIDVEELLKHVVFEATIPSILKGGDTNHSIYPAPVREFELHQYQSSVPFSIQGSPGEIILFEQGNAIVEVESRKMEVKRGEALFVTHQTQISIIPDENLRLYLVLIPGG